MEKLGICLGNLKTKDILTRLGIELDERVIEEMESKRIENADVPKGRWHGFDIPFQINCGDAETAKYITNILSPLASEFKTQIQIAHK